MKILITAPSLDENENVSGISTVVRQIVEHGKADFYHFQAGRRDGEQTNASWIYKQAISIPKFLREMRRRKTDVVHINTALSPLSILRDSAFVAAARIAKRKVLLHLHGGRFLTRRFNNRFLESFVGKTLRQADAVIVLSEGEKRIVEQRWKNLKTRVLENAVPLDAAQPRKNESAEKTIIFLGLIDESKGAREIVEACRILKAENFDFSFSAFGTGALKDFFVAEMTKILGDKFYYGGVARGVEKWKHLAASDIFLLPSRWEGLPLALLEAMAAGCVPIVVDVPSVREVIKDGVNGFTVEPHNAAQVAEKIKFLLSNKVDWETLRENARKIVEVKFSLDDYIEKLETIYREITD